MAIEREITLTVSGPAGSGKTLISKYISKVLKESGLNVELNDEESISDIDENVISDNNLSRYKETTKITINTLMARRRSAGFFHND